LRSPEKSKTAFIADQQLGQKLGQNFLPPLTFQVLDDFQNHDTA
jgi:hypothetical protein